MTRPRLKLPVSGTCNKLPSWERNPRGRCIWPVSAGRRHLFTDQPQVPSESLSDSTSVLYCTVQYSTVALLRLDCGTVHSLGFETSPLSEVKRQLTRAPAVQSPGPLMSCNVSSASLSLHAHRAPTTDRQSLSVRLQTQAYAHDGINKNRLVPFPRHQTPKLQELSRHTIHLLALSVASSFHVLVSVSLL